MSLLKRMEQIRNNEENASENINSETVKIQENRTKQSAAMPSIDSNALLKARVQDLAIETINTLERNEGSRQTVISVISDILSTEAPNLQRGVRQKIIDEIYDDIMGYGPIEPLLSNPEISEIMVNGPYMVYIENKGKLVLTDIKFRDNEHVMNIIDRIVSTIGRHVDEASPMVDARLNDGSRVNVIIPPLSLVGPVITIRKFSKTPLSYHDLIRFNSLSPKMASFLEACVKGNLNIIVSGGTGSGKTTLLNVLSSFIRPDERIVTVEDAAEIQLMQEHVITLETRPANIEGKGHISIRDLVVNALRMRPDRIIVGEVRSSEALDMLQAMNTGHDGSMTTTHSNSPRDTISRIETMVMMAGTELPSKVIREQMSSAIDLIVHQSRLRDGTRKITSITEFCGMEGDVITTQDIFVYETSGAMDANGKFIGHFKPTGVHPKCLEKIKNNGVTVNLDWFKE
ncbi:MAG: CpaF family protein [Bacillota bacterium]|nr:CpaF family protein [Bacillota bacterium]